MGRAVNVFTFAGQASICSNATLKQVCGIPQDPGGGSEERGEGNEGCR